jgi:hypothetical protein
VVQRHYLFDSPEPADATVYAQRAAQIAALIGQNYTVQHIYGYASPEATVAYNLELAGRRASRARSDIDRALAQANVTPSTTIPAGVGQGELLGQTATGRPAYESELVAELSARLRGLSEAEQLDLLGIDPATLDAAGREDVRRRIDAFIAGTEEGRALSRRARWEKLFPFLRRVEVTLDRQEVTEPRLVGRTSTPTTCDAETLRWARQNLPALPSGERVPTSSGRC